MFNLNTQVAFDKEEWVRWELIPFLQAAFGHRKGYEQGFDWGSAVRTAENKIHTIRGIDDSDTTIEHIRDAILYQGGICDTDASGIHIVAQDVELIITLFLRHAITSGHYSLASFRGGHDPAVMGGMSPTGLGGEGTALAHTSWNAGSNSGRNTMLTEASLPPTSSRSNHRGRSTRPHPHALLSSARTYRYPPIEANLRNSSGMGRPVDLNGFEIPQVARNPHSLTGSPSKRAAMGLTEREHQRHPTDPWGFGDVDPWGAPSGRTGRGNRRGPGNLSSRAGSRGGFTRE